MNPLLQWLAAMSAIEWAAALTTLVCIWLTVKNRISNWPWGIVASLLYGWVFWQQKLYANAGLQILYYVPICIYGWWAWAKLGPTHSDDLPVTALSPKARLGWLAVSVLLSLVIGWPIARLTNDNFPYADSFVTGFSIVAQYLQTRKIFENWWLWIAVDALAAFYLFPAQHLWPTTIIYVIAFGMAIRGAWEWKPLIGKIVKPLPAEAATPS